MIAAESGVEHREWVEGQEGYKLKKPFRSDE
jgi:hypothetical protein